MKKENRRVFGALIVVFLLWAVVAELQVRVPIVKVDKKYLKPPVALKHFTFGYNDFTASLLWIRLLQNFDYCEGGKFGEGDYVMPAQDGDKVSAILDRKTKPPKCHKGWVYTMLDAISEIQPRFKLAYDTGGTFLSVVVDDREGARLIFEKGLKIYKADWQLAYTAAYHYLWEVQEPKRAAELFLQAVQSGAPGWVYSLSAALYTKVGQAKIAKSILENALLNNPHGIDEERIKIRLQEVNEILKKEDAP